MNTLNQSIPRRCRKFTVAILIVSLPWQALADERLKGIACRSVHLGYPTPKATEFYNEVCVDQSAEGSYFMVCGWHGGYFGLQEQAPGKKVIIFSVWDQHEGNNPKDVPDEQRVRVLHQDPAVRIGRFGGEGTGGQSFLDFDWKTGETYRLLVRAKGDGERTAYSGWFFVPADKSWKHLVTFSTRNKGKLLEGCYSFVEDFRRNRVSTTHTRRASFGNGWFYDLQGNWVPITRAHFTADGNPVTNIDAGIENDRFFLATGGDIQNAHTPLWKHIERKAENLVPPADLPQ